MKILKYLMGASLLLPFAVSARPMVELPPKQQPTSFAIVVDQTTWQHAAAQLRAYRDALVRDGLAAYILADEWHTPEQVRGELLRLKKRCERRSPLEGVVFVGDIPIAMVRNAQHLTTAFKMNEETFPVVESSVPSDRYYDCPDLQFDLMARDTINPLLSYFTLRCDAPQRLAPAFYSGRIRYPEGMGGDKYEAIARYLEKVVRERARTERLEEVTTYAGDGYNSDCLVCWMDEQIAMAENFPLTQGRESDRLRQLNFRMDKEMKFLLFDELRRDPVDLMLFNEHGSPDKQHVGTYSEPDCMAGIYARLRSSYTFSRYYELRKGDKADVKRLQQDFARRYGVTERFFDAADREEEKTPEADPSVITSDELFHIAPQPRCVLLNACYNGSFHQPRYIAGGYIFSDGRTVVAQGNTVNVLQDRWTIEMVGLLSHGVRVGQYNRLIATLEGHIIGDPAFRFRPVVDNRLAQEIVLRRYDNAYWRTLTTESPYADVRSLALRMLADNGAVSPEELLRVMQTERFATTRTEALRLLSLSGDEEMFARGVRLALKDRYELLRRHAATYAWQLGREDLVQEMADAWVRDSESQRVAYILQKGLLLMPDSVADAALKRAVKQWGGGSETLYDDLRSRLASSREMKRHDHERLLRGTSLRLRIAALRSMRNNTYHEYVGDLLDVLSDAGETDELRRTTAECLGWFVHTPRRSEVVLRCRKLLKTLHRKSPLRDELQQTILRLEGKHTSIK